MPNALALRMRYQEARVGVFLAWVLAGGSLLLHYTPPLPLAPFRTFRDIYN
jgi:hypothetical protein